MGLIPPHGGDKKSAADMAGTYKDAGCDACTTHVCAVGPCLCICFKFCGCPYSGTPACPTGDNVWVNFQGYCITADGDKVHNQYLCCPAELERVNGGGAPPVVNEAMER